MNWIRIDNNIFYVENIKIGSYLETDIYFEFYVLNNSYLIFFEKLFNKMINSRLKSDFVFNLETINFNFLNCMISSINKEENKIGIEIVSDIRKNQNKQNKRDLIIDMILEKQ